jgi:hypothetical protein
MAQRTMWPSIIVIIPPLLDLAPRVFDRQELTDVQTFIAKTAIKTLNMPVICRLSRSSEVELDPPSISPFVHGPRCELRTIVDRNRRRRAVRGRSGNAAKLLGQRRRGAPDLTKFTICRLNSGVYRIIRFATNTSVPYGAASTKAGTSTLP